MQDYKKLDKTYRFNKRKIRLQIAKSLGYDYISEAIIKTYRETKSLSKTAKIFNYYDDSSVFHIMQKLKEPINSPGRHASSLSPRIGYRTCDKHPDTYDYALMDQDYGFTYQEDRLKIAHALGCKYISEAIIKTYQKTKSQNTIHHNCIPKI